MVYCMQSAVSAAGINLTSFGVDINMCSVPSGSSVSGAYLQASSQFPGKGPCYPIWAATVPYFNRWAGSTSWLHAVLAAGHQAASQPAICLITSLHSNCAATEELLIIIIISMTSTHAWHASSACIFSVYAR